MKINPRIPVSSQGESNKISSFFNGYFYYGGKTIRILSPKEANGKINAIIQEKTTSTQTVSTMLKIASLFTIVAPLIGLACLIKNYFKYKNVEIVKAPEPTPASSPSLPSDPLTDPSTDASPLSQPLPPSDSAKKSSQDSAPADLNHLALPDLVDDDPITQPNPSPNTSISPSPSKAGQGKLKMISIAHGEIPSLFNSTVRTIAANPQHFNDKLLDEPRLDISEAILAEVLKGGIPLSEEQGASLGDVKFLRIHDLLQTNLENLLDLLQKTSINRLHLEDFASFETADPAEQKKIANQLNALLKLADVKPDLYFSMPPIPLKLFNMLGQACKDVLLERCSINGELAYRGNPSSAEQRRKGLFSNSHTSNKLTNPLAQFIDAYLSYIGWQDMEAVFAKIQALDYFLQNSIKDPLPTPLLDAFPAAQDRMVQYDQPHLGPLNAYLMLQVLNSRSTEEEQQQAISLQIRNMSPHRMNGRLLPEAQVVASQLLARHASLEEFEAILKSFDYIDVQQKPIASWMKGALLNGDADKIQLAASYYWNYLLLNEFSDGDFSRLIFNLGEEVRSFSKNEGGAGAISREALEMMIKAFPYADAVKAADSAQILKKIRLIDQALTIEYNSFGQIYKLPKVSKNVGEGYREKLANSQEEL